jgi:hypothetical protein
MDFMNGVIKPNAVKEAKKKSGAPSRFRCASVNAARLREFAFG